VKKTIYKIFLLWQFDEEENWINKMSEKGLQLCYVGFGKYVFEEGLPNEYIYRLELLERTKEREYIAFIEETGAETVCRFGSWIYFRKKSREGEFNLFSDIASRIRHLDRILPWAGFLCGVNLFNGISQLCFLIFRNNSVNGSLSLAIPSILLIIAGLFIGYGSLRVFSKIQKLKKEQIIQE